MVTKIILIRHCEATGNLTKSFQGSIDCDITERGRKQLDALSERMKNVSFDAIYSSPLIRAVKTAEAVDKYANRKIILNDDIKEINAGVLEGMAYVDMPKKYPYADECWKLHPHDFAPEGGETMRELYSRVWRGVTEIAVENVGKTTCIVSHGCAIRNIICRAKGLPIESLNSVAWCDNTALSVIQFDDFMNPTLISENDASHLTDDIYTSCSDMLSTK